jgi:hypothetical protein
MSDNYNEDNLVMESRTETPTLDTKSEEDPKLYQDAEGKHAKIDTDKGTEGKDKKNKASIAGKVRGPASFEKPVPSGTSQERMEDHLSALFDGEDLSEDFQNKAVTIFEAAINDRVSDIENNLVEQYQDILTENIAAISEDMSEKLDDYLSYVVEQWVEENTLEIENGIRTEVAENFISGLKVLFENSYIDIPEEKYDMVAELGNSQVNLENELNEALQANIELQSKLTNQRCGKIFVEESYGLTDIEVEKLQSLTEGIEYETVDQYREKVTILRDSYFGNEPVLIEDTDVDEERVSRDNNTEPMNNYLSAISRHTKSNRVS